MVTSRMNITQEPLTAALPPPCSIETPAASNRTDLPANKANNNVNLNPAAPDPSRCEFFFSDGRQCRMQSSGRSHQQDELSPVKKVQFCAHHASKQERDPGATSAPHHALELPELQALCGDLTTATNINRALAQVFLLLAQGRIPQKQAVAFGYLSQLLLQTVPGIRSEYVSAFGYHPWEEKLKHSLERKPAREGPADESDDATSVVILSSSESHLQDELSLGNKVQLE